MKKMEISFIREMCAVGKLRWTNHMFVRLLQRNIKTEEIVYVLTHGEIIEQYPDDYPYPSCLVLGITVNGRPIHVVCGAGETELWLITVYYPSMEEWEPDFKTRKGDVS